MRRHDLNRLALTGLVLTFCFAVAGCGGGGGGQLVDDNLSAAADRAKPGGGGGGGGTPVAWIQPSGSGYTATGLGNLGYRTYGNGYQGEAQNCLSDPASGAPGGYVAAAYLETSTSASRPCRWEPFDRVDTGGNDIDGRPGTLVALSVPKQAFRSVATAVRPDGTTVGWATIPAPHASSTQRATVWPLSGSRVDLSPTNSTAMGINASGTVSGVIGASSALWLGSTAAVTGIEAFPAYVVPVNDYGIQCYRSSLFVPNTPNTGTGVVQTIPGVGDRTEVRLAGLTDVLGGGALVAGGQIERIYGFLLPKRAAVWRDSDGDYRLDEETPLDLHAVIEAARGVALGQSQIWSVSSDGKMLGRYGVGTSAWDGNFVAEATDWGDPQSVSITFVEDVLSGGDAWASLVLSSINSAGWIVATGYAGDGTSELVMLTPGS